MRGTPGDTESARGMSIYQYFEHSAERRDVSMSLSEKHSPTDASSMFGRRRETQAFCDWLGAFRAPGAQRFLMVSGPSGCGKTTIARLCVQKAGFRALDINPSLNRNKKDVMEMLSLCNGGRYAMVFDEFDFMDNFSLADVNVLMEAYPRIPFVFVVSRHTHGKTFDLSKSANLIAMSPLPVASLVEWTRGIMAAEGMDAGVAERVVDTCKGDMRGVLKWLELHKHYNVSDLSPATWQTQKDDDVDCIRATKLLLHSAAGLSVAEALRLVKYDINLITSMVSENYLLLTHDMQAASLCADLVSVSATVESFIYMKQAWDLWDTFALCGAVAPAALVRRDSSEEPTFTRMWSKISNMYYRIYQLDDVRMCMKRNRSSHDDETLMFMGAKAFNEIANGNITGCIQEMVRMGMSSDNINMTVKYGTMTRYKNTLQKKIKKEFDKVAGKGAAGAAGGRATNGKVKCRSRHKKEETAK